MPVGAGLSTPVQASTAHFTQSAGGLFQSPQTAVGAGGGLFSQGGGQSVGGIGRSLGGGLGTGALGGAGLGRGGLGLGVWFVPSPLISVTVCSLLWCTMPSILSHSVFHAFSQFILDVTWLHSLQWELSDMVYIHGQ